LNFLSIQLTLIDINLMWHRSSGLTTTKVTASNIGNTTTATTMLPLRFTPLQFTLLRLIPLRLIQFLLTRVVQAPPLKTWTWKSLNVVNYNYNWRLKLLLPIIQVILLYLCLHFDLVVTSSAGQVCHFLLFPAIKLML
jgi:hypothetical protein